MNRKTALIITVTLIIGIIIGGCLVFFIHSNKAKNKGEVLTEVQAKDIALSKVILYYTDGKLAYADHCSMVVCKTDSTIEIDTRSRAYELIDYKNLEEVKKSLSTLITDNMFSKITSKFIEKDDKIYCYIPSMSWALINKDSIKVTNIENNKENSFDALVEYTTGGDQLFEEGINHAKVSFKYVNNSWLIDNISQGNP